MKTRAFTLIELLVVVAVLAILAAIAVPNFLEAQTRSKVSRVYADLRTQRTGIEAYAADHNMYPRMSWGDPPYNDLYTGHGSILQPVWGTLGPWLTTPTAYLTVYDTIDPFATNPKVQADLRLYTYHDLRTRRLLVQPGFAQFPTPYTEENNAEFEAAFGAYGQMSMGPDRNSAPFYLPYDPTNGTTSAGNIWVSQKNGGPPGK